jgi:hypothetical protein
MAKKKKMSKKTKKNMPMRIPVSAKMKKQMGFSK